MQTIKEKINQVDRNFTGMGFSQAANTVSIQDELARRQYRDDLFGNIGE